MSKNGDYIVKSLIKIGITYTKGDLTIPDPSGDITFRFLTNAKEGDNGVYTVEVQSVQKSSNWKDAYNLHQTKLIRALNILSAYYLKPSWLHDTRGDVIVYKLGESKKLFVYWHVNRFSREALIKTSDINELKAAYLAELDDKTINALEFVRFALRSVFGREAFVDVMAAIDSLLPQKPYNCPNCGEELYTRTDWNDLKKYGLTKSEAYKAKGFRNSLGHGNIITKDDEKVISELVPKIVTAFSHMIKECAGFKDNRKPDYGFIENNAAFVVEILSKHPASDENGLPFIDEDIPFNDLVAQKFNSEYYKELKQEDAELAYGQSA